MKLVAAAALAFTSTSFAPVDMVDTVVVPKQLLPYTSRGCIEVGPDTSRRDDFYGTHREGARSQGSVLMIVKEALPRMRACGASHGVTEDVHVEWAIDEHGAVQGAHALANHATTPVGVCVADVVSSLSFAEGQAVPRVTFPIRMR